MPTSEENGKNKKRKKSKGLTEEATSVQEDAVDTPKILSKVLDSAQGRKKERKRQKLEMAEDIFNNGFSTPREQNKPQIDTSLMAKMNKKLSGSKFR